MTLSESINIWNCSMGLNNSVFGCSSHNSHDKKESLVVFIIIFKEPQIPCLIIALIFICNMGNNQCLYSQLKNHVLNRSLRLPPPPPFFSPVSFTKLICSWQVRCLSEEQWKLWVQSHRCFGHVVLSESLLKVRVHMELPLHALGLVVNSHAEDPEDAGVTKMLFVKIMGKNAHCFCWNWAMI